MTEQKYGFVLQILLDQAIVLVILDYVLHQPFIRRLRRQDFIVNAVDDSKRFPFDQLDDFFIVGIFQFFKVDAIFLVDLFFLHENVVDEAFLKFFIGVVDAELVEWVVLHDFEPVDIKNSNWLLLMLQESSWYSADLVVDLADYLFE